MHLRLGWIPIVPVVMLGVLSLLVGCTPAGPLEITASVEPVAAGTLPAPTVAQPAAQPVRLANPGFEEGETDGLPAGWTIAGATEAVKLDDRGHSGDFIASMLRSRPSASFSRRKDRMSRKSLLKMPNIHLSRWSWLERHSAYF